MAYITKARQEVNATLANAISSRFSNKAREEEMRRTRDEWEKAPTNPKNRKKLRNAGQNDPYLPGDTQLELDISEKGLGNLKIAGKPTIGQYNYNPSESLLVRNYAFENPEGSMTIEQGSEGWIPQQLGTVADYEIAGGQSFEIPGKRKTGFGSLTPEGVEQLKKANPGAAEKIDQKFKEQQGGTDLFPLAQNFNPISPTDTPRDLKIQDAVNKFGKDKKGNYKNPQLLIRELLKA